MKILDKINYILGEEGVATTHAGGATTTSDVVANLAKSRLPNKKKKLLIRRQPESERS